MRLEKPIMCKSLRVEYSSAYSYILSVSFFSLRLPEPLPPNPTSLHTSRRRFARKRPRVHQHGLAVELAQILADLPPIVLEPQKHFVEAGERERGPQVSPMEPNAGAVVDLIQDDKGLVHSAAGSLLELLRLDEGGAIRGSGCVELDQC